MNLVSSVSSVFKKRLEMETESDKSNVYHESHTFVSHVRGALLVQLLSKRFYLNSSVAVQTH